MRTVIWFIRLACWFSHFREVREKAAEFVTFCWHGDRCTATRLNTAVSPFMSSPSECKRSRLLAECFTDSLTSTETTRLIRDGEKGGGGYGGGGRGRLYTYRYTVTSRMTSALKWAAMRAILMFHNCEEQSLKTVSTDHNF